MRLCLLCLWLTAFVFFPRHVLSFYETATTILMRFCQKVHPDAGVCFNCRNDWCQDWGCSITRDKAFSSWRRASTLCLSNQIASNSCLRNDLDMCWRESCPLLYFSAREPCDMVIRVENKYKENSIFGMKRAWAMSGFQGYRKKPEYPSWTNVK